MFYFLAYLVFVWQLPHQSLGGMQSGDCRMDVMEYQACIAMMSGHHQSDMFWSNEMSTGTVISLSEIPPGYHIFILYFILSVECLLSAPFGSIFLLHTMLSISLFFQLFLKSDLDFSKSNILYWKIIISHIALNHRSSCWILILNCHKEKKSYPANF